MPILSIFPAHFTARRGSAAPLDIYDPFTASDGALNGRTPADNGGSGALTWSASNWTIASNYALSTPTESAEKLTNGAFEGAAPDGWTNNGTSTNERSTEQVHGDTYARKLAAASAAKGIYQHPAGLTNMRWGKVAAWLYPTSGSAYAAAFGVNSAPATTLNAWTRVSAIGRYMTTGAYAASIYSTAAAAWYADDASVVELTTADLFAVLNCGAPAAFNLSAAFTGPAARPMGLAMCLDSVANPQNYVLAWRHTNTAVLEKVVGGTRTQLISATAIYNAGARLAVERSGTSFRLLYDGAQIGATQTIEDAGILSNTLQGIFSTSADVTVEDFRAVAGLIPVVTVIGDSISAAHATEPGDWTYQLVRSGPLGAVNIKNHAVNGQTVLSHMDAQVSAAASDAADVVVILLGVNDTTDSGFQDEYTENVSEIMASNANATVYCLGILPNSGSPYAARRTLYNPLIAAAAAAAGASYVNTDDWIDPATETSDGLHPNAAGAVKVLAQIRTATGL